MRCKDYYQLFLEKKDKLPTAKKTWSEKNEVIADNWEKSINNIYKTTKDNKLKQFSFKLLHRILITKKELKRYGIVSNSECVECHEPDSLEHTFMECTSSLELHKNILNWFNAQHHTNINPTVAQILLNFCQLSPVSNSLLFRKISLLLQHVKQYIYANKSLNKNLDRAECISKLERTWKINEIV